MKGVHALASIAVVVAACRGADEDVTAPLPPSFGERDASTPAIRIAVHVDVPMMRPGAVASVTASAPVTLPPPMEVAVAVPLEANALDRIDVDDGPRVVPGDALDDRLALGTDGPLARPKRRAYGIAFDVGVPDGATAALVIHPVRTLAVSAGLSYNGISYGGRAGITWTPLAGTLSPTLSADVGHFAEGDANPLVQLVTGKPMFSSPVLDRVGYDYANAHIGLAVTRRSFTFFVRAGVSRVTGAIHGLSDVTSGKMVTFGSDPTVTLTTVSARLGVIFYFAK